ncbi:hypothetical protein GCM10007079_06910 [Nocardiopsis terrae]|uniref:RelA/SpoT domain-containing protein n=1 Tax=Nocardiopsis terrae TaxID=372655 RepID=A0ABR9HP45_9ACTN|nr:hypothetical protein [Nocardiopsis terrae]MBE1460738.1 hypothetical protein [Nocardiopsis terrae]GHC73191.1 hypothetical protein GCM10007079_06910 [Nocardiopsis terrae]
MPLPLSKSQIVRLGERLVRQAEPAEDDLGCLNELLLAYDEALEHSMELLRDLGFAPSGRIKNTGTILEKLRRHGGSWLKSIQDLAGMRVIIRGGRREQDDAVARIVRAFQGQAKQPRITDRRDQPSSGYRAVHVIAYPDGLPVEIQVRTAWQHEWAEMFEKLADVLGRGIRYGEAPTDWRDALDLDLEPTEDRRLIMRRLADAAYTQRVLMVRLALTVGDLIAVLEEAELDGVAPDSPEVQEHWQTVEHDLEELQSGVLELEPIRDR